ncbi:MAG: hypothetical protein K8T25_06835 [Planctomycetia bacterium]|nr:hypothetical protein [Planctomycetia bacterium]
MDVNVDIKRIAPLLNALHKSRSPELTYHIFSDALVWSDEYPHRPLGDDAILRYLLMYRTSLIIGEPIEALEQYWQSAQIAFPKWPGFAVERCTPSVEWRTKYEQLKAQAERALEEAGG